MSVFCGEELKKESSQGCLRAFSFLTLILLCYTFRSHLTGSLGCPGSHGLVTPSQPEETSETVVRGLGREWLTFVTHGEGVGTDGIGEWGGGKQRGRLEY